MVLNHLSSSNSVSMIGHTLFGFGRESPDPSAFPTWWGVFFLPCFLPPDYMIDSESVVDVKPGDSGMVFGDQGDEFTCIWLADYFFS